MMDFQEKEVKFYLRDLEAMAARLEATGAELVRPRVFERNLRLDTADGGLTAEKRVLRLRQDDKVHVTYKDKTHTENGVLVRTEIEFATDNLEVTLKLFEALRYQVVMIYEKYRRAYRLGDVEVVLDEMPFGNFMEIEAPNTTLIEGVAQMLGLNWDRRGIASYLGIFDVLKQHREIRFRDLTFENFASLQITPADLEVEPADD
jgi:adenylate cyclase class 2